MTCKCMSPLMSVNLITIHDIVYLSRNISRSQFRGQAFCDLRCNALRLSTNIVYDIHNRQKENVTF
jgi:hypothetical protein